MEFLKDILGEELYAQFVAKVNEHNGNEANKDKQVKIGNLGTGEYVGKGKYDALQELVNGKETELKSANELIAELKKGTKGNEELQKKIGDYDAQVAQLQTQLQETKIKSAIKVGLLEEGCADVDYVTYKLMESLREKGETLELDENENIKGWNDRISGLKTQLPTQFTSKEGGKKEYDVDNLPGGDGGNDTVTKEQFNKMGYNSRVELKNSNPELYAKLAN
jgi:hypothetical protein